MAHRTNEDNQRDSMEEKEIYKNMKNNKEKRYRVEYNIVGDLDLPFVDYKECFVMAKNKKEAEQKFNDDDVKESEPKIKRIELVKEHD